MVKIVDYMKRAFYRRVADEIFCPTGSLAGRLVWKRLEKQNTLLAQTALEKLGILPHEKVLDLGCSTGAGLQCAYLYIREGNGHVYGVDWPSVVIERAQTRMVSEVLEGRVTILRSRLETLPFLNNSLDKIFHCNGCLFWPSLGHVSSEIFRILRPGGRLVGALDLNAIRDFEKKAAFEIPKHDPLDYLISLEHSGFEDVKFDYVSDDSYPCGCIYAKKPSSIRLESMRKSDEIVETELENSMKQHDMVLSDIKSAVQRAQAMKETSEPTDRQS